MPNLHIHRLEVDGGKVTVVRERIERVLGVTTKAEPFTSRWIITFEAPVDIDLEFLRPDVLPPANWRRDT